MDTQVTSIKNMSSRFPKYSCLLMKKYMTLILFLFYAAGIEKNLVDSYLKTDENWIRKGIWKAFI